MKILLEANEMKITRDNLEKVTILSFMKIRKGTGIILPYRKSAKIREKILVRRDGRNIQFQIQ